jgi:hypothetical protein
MLFKITYMIPLITVMVVYFMIHNTFFIFFFNLASYFWLYFSNLSGFGVYFPNWILKFFLRC